MGGAITSIAGKLGMSAETLRLWVRKAEVDGGLREGVSSGDRELRRANEILKAAAAFFGAELDRKQKK